MRRSLVLALTLAFAACRDPGAEAFARAKAAYDAQLAKAEPVEARGFDDVLALLDAVPDGSKHAAAARKLAENIRRARVHPRTPLAVAPTGARPAELEAQLAACVRLAQLVGLDGGVDRRALEALEACRRRAEAIDLKYAHPEHADAGMP